jgi:glycosyltransferase involved in cell wall biosynthesis
MKILVLPRDPNPYQSLLYGEMQRLGAEVIYVGELTPSQTLNLLLLPLEVTAHRIGGARVIHLHWVFAFTIPGTHYLPAMRRVAYLWFRFWLRTCHLLGLHLIWTVHNVLPHKPVFPDDVSARRALVRSSELVLAHSYSALSELAALGAVARRSAIIQHGPIAPAGAHLPLSAPGACAGPRKFLFLGRVQDYKGVDDLLVAFAAIHDDIAAHLTVVGQCDDPRLRSRLGALAREGGRSVTLRLDRVPEEEVAQLLAAADVVVLPFRRVTTSGSAMLALAHGRPLIVPDLPALSDLPDQAVLRYDGGVSELADALTKLARADRAVLAAMSVAAINYAARTTWQEIAEKTLAQIYLILGGNSEADVRDRPVGSSVK